MDFVYLGCLLIFSVLTFALIEGCSRLGGKP